MIRNLTPHAIWLFSPETPETATQEQLDAGLVLRIPVSGGMARLVTTPHPAATPVSAEGEKDGEEVSAEIAVHPVAFGAVAGLPDPEPGVWYVVPLLTALAVDGRDDLLIVHEQVRNLAETVVGCRSFGRVARVS